MPPFAAVLRMLEAADDVSDLRYVCDKADVVKEYLVRLDRKDSEEECRAKGPSSADRWRTGPSCKGMVAGRSCVVIVLSCRSRDLI
jgi:hypothetical protein